MGYLPKNFFLIYKSKDQPTDWHISSLWTHFCSLVPFYKTSSLCLFQRPSGTVGGEFCPWALTAGRGGANTRNIWELVCLFMWKWHSLSTSFRYQSKLQLWREKNYGHRSKEGTQQRRGTQIFPSFSDSLYIWLCFGLDLIIYSLGDLLNTALNLAP